MNNTFCSKCHRIPSQCCCLPVSKAIVAETELNHMRSFFGCDPAYYGMTPAEPVAWINLDRFKNEALYLADCVSENKVDNMGITTPLYTHPAKTLTDEEIWKLWQQHLDDEIPVFVRAILRKAQSE